MYVCGLCVVTHTSLFSRCHLYVALCWWQYGANARKYNGCVNTGYVTLATSHWLYKHNVSHMHIHTDSPAARTSLKCGDELLAVNGQSLQDATHSEATKILHKVNKQS